jgi:heme-degrading monooxygenase HmoA
MLIRIVRMTFQKDRTTDFLAIFDRSKSLIRSFDGCQHLELLRDVQHPNVYLTYSYWESESALETYRCSELFQSTWAATKVLFADKPVAYSVQRIEVVSVEG